MWSKGGPDQCPNWHIIIAPSRKYVPFIRLTNLQRLKAWISIESMKQFPLYNWIWKAQLPRPNSVLEIPPFLTFFRIALCKPTFSKSLQQPFLDNIWMRCWLFYFWVRRAEWREVKAKILSTFAREHLSYNFQMIYYYVVYLNRASCVLAPINYVNLFYYLVQTCARVHFVFALLNYIKGAYNVLKLWATL